MAEVRRYEYVAGFASSCTNVSLDEGRRAFSLPGTRFAPMVDYKLEVPAIFVVPVPK
jgi:hypothetical protein